MSRSLALTGAERLTGYMSLNAAHQYAVIWEASFSSNDLTNYHLRSIAIILREQRKSEHEACLQLYSYLDKP